MSDPAPPAESPNQSPSPPTRYDGQKVAAARLWAVHKFPYLATAMFATTVVPTPDLKGVAVDEHWRLYVDPVIVDAVTVEDLGTVMVHHVGHLLRDHAERARSIGIVGERLSGSSVDDSAADETTSDAFKRWTLAADLEINDDLSDMQLPLAEDAVQPEQYEFDRGRMAEEYFHLLPATLTPRGSCKNCGSGADGACRGWESGEGGVNKAASQLLRCQVAGEVLRHARQYGRGSVPSGMQRWAEEILRPQVDWRAALAAELRRGLAAVAGAVDYTYRRPSRRSSAVPRIILPALQKPIPHVAIVCDTSGSMGSDQLAQVLAEVDGILRAVGVRSERVRVLSCDAAVHAVQKVNSARQVNLYGGGGTDMGVGIKAALALKPKPSVIVVLTDGMTPWPSEQPPASVVVGIIGDLHQRWGREGGDRVPEWARVVHVGELVSR